MDLHPTQTDLTLSITAMEIDQFLAGICSAPMTEHESADDGLRPTAPVTGVPSAESTHPDNGFAIALVNDFFPDMQNNVQSRMQDNPLSKLALGQICMEILEGQQAGSAFFECGSTVALSVLGMRNSRRIRGSMQSQIALSTNSALVQTALYSLGESIPRLLYGDQFLNAQKYLGFFPIHPRTILNAIHGSNAAKSELQDVWRQMCRDGARFDVSLLTASRFHFISGPFVGSIDNSFLKFAFYSSALDLRILIDGTKCLNHRHLPAEWKKDDCYESMLGIWPDEKLADFVAKLFPEAARGEREQLMEAIEEAAHRNPQASVTLPPVFVNRRDIRERAETDVDATEEIRVVDSWRSCVEQVLSRNGGAVTVYIAEPDSEVHFEQRLQEAIDETNVSLRKLRSSLRVRMLECSTVYVHKPTRALRANGDHSCEAVRIWRCGYYYRTNARPMGNRARTRSSSDLPVT